MACEDPTMKASRNADSREKRRVDLDDLTADTFAPHLYDWFTVHFDGDGPTGMEPVELQLIEIGRFEKLRRLEGGFEHRPRAPFSLLFRGRHQDAFPSGVWIVRHRVLGELRLFLNPVQVSSDYPADQNPEGLFYETVFS
jgi:hypothetical protein